MQLPEWATNTNETFWKRHYELATLTEQACELAIERQLEKWLREVELTDGPAPAGSTTRAHLLSSKQPPLAPDARFG
jgi:hypothetical protein